MKLIHHTDRLHKGEPCSVCCRNACSLDQHRRRYCIGSATKRDSEGEGEVEIEERDAAPIDQPPKQCLTNGSKSFLPPLTSETHNSPITQNASPGSSNARPPAARTTAPKTSHVSARPRFTVATPRRRLRLTTRLSLSQA